MKKINLKSIRIQNFKGCKKRYIDFGVTTKIKGQNAVGKTTVFDSFTWLLFGRDSLGSTKFDIRPLDNTGNPVHKIEISVEAMLDVDGEEVSLKKVQREKWTKKRGTAIETFSGNVNEYEINGYPKSEKEFKEFVSGIIDEDIFSLVTNPMAFASMPWKNQRQILMKFVGDLSDVQIAERFGSQFEKLIPELKNAGTDDILKKYNKCKNDLNKKMIEIPSRIDEVSKQLVEVDVASLELEKQVKETLLNKVETRLKSGNQNQINELKSQIMDKKLKISEIQNEENHKLENENAVIRNNYYVLEQESKLIMTDIDDIKIQIKANDYKIEELERRGKLLNSDYAEEKAKKIEPLKEDDLVCPTCGRPFDEDKRLEMIRKQSEKSKKLEEVKQKRLKELSETGKKLSDQKKEIEKAIDVLRDKLVAAEEISVKNQKSLNKARNDFDNMVTVADISKLPEVVTLNEDISKLESDIFGLEKSDIDRAELENQKAVLKAEINEYESEIASADNSKVKARIAELEEEMKAVGQRIADQEQMIDLTEEFVREKMNLISEIINKKFDVVNFNLFKSLINGGLQEICECTVNNVPYSSLNNGHRIVAGLDIIRSLSELYGVSAPIFIDNAESINDFNIPDVNNQMILLEVTEDKEMVVE